MASRNAQHPIIPGFTIIKSINSGTTAVVYHAIDNNNRHVALKVLHPSQLTSADSVRRFKQEAEALGRVEEHSNIARLYHSNVVGEFYFISMEYCTGGPLSKRRFSPAGAAAVVCKLARALAHAHRKRVVHRDVKCDNIVFGKDDEPKLLDFGLSLILNKPRYTSVDPVTGTRRAVGSDGHSPPEQQRGDSGPKADQFALGVVLYELLFRQRPPTNARQIPLFRIAATHDVPIRLMTVCKRMMHLDPARRYPTCDDVVTSIARCLGPTGIQTLSSGLGRDLSQKPIIWLSLAGVLAATVVITLLSLPFVLSRPPVQIAKANEQAPDDAKGDAKKGPKEDKFGVGDPKVDVKRAKEPLPPLVRPLIEPTGTPVEVEFEGGVFRCLGSISIEGEHGGSDEHFRYFDDVKGGTATLIVNNQKLPGGGFAVYQTLPEQPVLLSAYYAPAMANGALGDPIDVLAQMKALKSESAGNNILIRYYPLSKYGRDGGEWRFTYGKAVP
jgi:serine/threonine-protein kinase